MRGIEEIKEGISVITPTMRQACIPKLIENYKRQAFKNKELIIVINNDQMDKNDFGWKERIDPNIHIYQLPENETLGVCLNYAIEKSKYFYIAKFDDDDYYGANYLNEVYDSFVNRKCDIVCKRSIFYYLESYGELTILPPLMECQNVSRGAGATICITRDVFDKVQYSDISKGSDVDFFKKCHGYALKIYSTSCYNYLCFRSKEVSQHTWQIGAEELKTASKKCFSKVVSLEEACQFVNHYVART